MASELARAARVGGVFLLALGAASCRRPFGLVYTNVRYPLTENMRHTPVGEKESELDTKEIYEPVFTRARISWDSNAVGDIAERNGFSEIYYADKQTVSVLLGIWRQEYVVLHGK